MHLLEFCYICPNSNEQSVEYDSEEEEAEDEEEEEEEEDEDDIEEIEAEPIIIEEEPQTPIRPLRRTRYNWNMDED